MWQNIRQVQIKVRWIHSDTLFEHVMINSTWQRLCEMRLLVPCLCSREAEKERRMLILDSFSLFTFTYRFHRSIQIPVCTYSYYLVGLCFYNGTFPYHCPSMYNGICFFHSLDNRKKKQLSEFSCFGRVYYPSVLSTSLAWCRISVKFHLCRFAYTLFLAP